jgi:hypothetical protein
LSPIPDRKVIKISFATATYEQIFDKELLFFFVGLWSQGFMLAKQAL